MNRVAKFYKTVDAAPDVSGFIVCLDGRPIRTPAKRLMALPTAKLADAIAEEWRAQKDALDPQTMPLTRLSYASLDTVSGHRARVIEEILGYGKSDLLCYRAEAPKALVARQSEAWDPLLDWAAKRYGARLKTGTGITYVAQSAESQTAFVNAVETRDDFALAGLHSATSLTGSLVLALALADGRLSAHHAFVLSRLDETFQSEAWGRDAEAEARAGRLGEELAAIERFLRLARP
jgi:chaperone required for assembly of F1-ATPase